MWQLIRDRATEIFHFVAEKSVKRVKAADAAPNNLAR
jgi:hypothetical protein